MSQFVPGSVTPVSAQSNFGIVSRRETNRRIRLRKRYSRSHPRTRPEGEQGVWPIVAPGTMTDLCLEHNGQSRRWVFTAQPPIKQVREDVVSRALSRLAIDHFYEALAYNRPGGGSICFDYWCPATAERPELHLEVTTGGAKVVSRKLRRARSVAGHWPVVVIVVTSTDLDLIESDHIVLQQMIEAEVAAFRQRAAA